MPNGINTAFRRIQTYAALVKLEHTVFALPFAYMGAFLGAGGLPSAAALVWITIAMVGARTMAMGFNRLIDRNIDARNPRTADRHLPRGLVAPREVLAMIAVSAALLMFSAWQLNPLCFKLLPFALILVVYPYTKRFTCWCHLVVGASLGLAPMGGWIGVTGSAHSVIYILGAIVTLWVAGFDIIYAIMDLDFDRREGLHSIPSRYGTATALKIARAFHAVVMLLIVLVYFYLHLSWFYLAGAAVTAVLLHYEHSIVSPKDLSRINMAFFTLNGVVSIVLFIFTMADVLVY